MKSIQTKFVLLILVCIFCAVAVVGGAGIFTAQRVVDEDSARIMNLMSAEKSQEINALLSRIEQSVRTLAVFAVGRLDSLEKFKHSPDYVNNYTKLLESVAINAASNTEGAMAVYVRFNPEFTEPTSGLFWNKTSLDGTFRPLVPTDFSRFNPNDTERVGWYYIPIRNGKPTWITPYLNKNINVRMISFVIPLYMNNQTVGVVGMDIDFSVLTDIVKNINVYKSGYAFLTDKAANVMYHRDFEMGTPLAEADGALRSVAAEIRGGSSGSMLFPYTWRNVEKKMATRVLANDMRLSITSPVEEIDSAKNSLVTIILLALLVITLLSSVMTVFMTRRLTQPLRELNNAAKRIAAGDLNVSLTQQTKDEVGSLAESFQQTVENLQKYVNYINGLAYRDSLTGVKNKTAFQEVEARIEEQMRIGKPEFALVVLDINDLKRTNDRYGHDFGDMLITNACRIICKAFHHSPVYRIGGDEFVAVLEGNDYAHYGERLQALADDIDKHNAKSRTDCKISVARGIAVYNSQTDLVFGNVFKRADESMYQNKAAMKSQKASGVENAVQNAAAV